MPDLLVISNGYGEDTIGAALIRHLPGNLTAEAYPTLGTGKAYEGTAPIVGPRAQLASEGSRVRRGTIARDIGTGGLATVWPGVRFLLGARRRYRHVAVVGDFIGVGACWVTGIRGITYVDVYKTGYGRPYLPIERRVIARTCATVFSRHPVLAASLTDEGIDARFAGNVMMDSISRRGFDPRPMRSRPTMLTLLPGSREETAGNFATEVAALRLIPEMERPDIFVALAGSVDPLELADAAGLQWMEGRFAGDLTIHGVRGALGDLVEGSDVVVSQAGTATVQTLGLGVPVITALSGSDRPKRTREESLLFGDGRVLVENSPQALAKAIGSLLRDPAERARRGAIGRERIGGAGAIDVIAETIVASIGRGSNR